MKTLHTVTLAAALLAASILSGCAADAYAPGYLHTPGYGNPPPNTPYSANDATAARVRNVLAADARVGVETLTIKVIDGVVELGGTPKDLQARDLAIRITERTYGVKRVINNMVFN
jgi:osmotically-inducible protein OsmY